MVLVINRPGLLAQQFEAAGRSGSSCIRPLRVVLLCRVESQHIKKSYRHRLLYDSRQQRESIAATSMLPVSSFPGPSSAPDVLVFQKPLGLPAGTDQMTCLPPSLRRPLLPLPLPSPPLCGRVMPRRSRHQQKQPWIRRLAPAWT